MKDSKVKKVSSSNACRSDIISGEEILKRELEGLD